MQRDPANRDAAAAVAALREANRAFNLRVRTCGVCAGAVLPAEAHDDTECVSAPPDLPAFLTAS
jgi:hypothetical protein